MKITNYLRETRSELRHVSWPTRRQAAQYTVLVVALSLIIAALLGSFDFVYDFLLQEFVFDDGAATDAPAFGVGEFETETGSEPFSEGDGEEASPGLDIDVDTPLSPEDVGTNTE